MLRTQCSLSKYYVFVPVCSIYLMAFVSYRVAIGQTEFNPQSFLLCFLYLSIFTILIVRLFRWKSIRAVFQQVYEHYDKTNMRVRRTKKYILIFMFSVMLFEDALILSNMKLVRQIVRIVLPLILVIVCPATVEFQYPTLCVVLREALLKVNRNLEQLLQLEHNASETDLEHNSRSHSTLMKVIKSVNKEYGFYVFLLSNTLMLLGIYNVNDTMIYASALKVNKQIHFSHYKIIFNMYSTFAVLCRLFWLAYESQQLIEEVR